MKFEMVSKEMHMVESILHFLSASPSHPKDHPILIQPMLVGRCSQEIGIDFGSLRD